jgi:hypothetical protein
MMAETTPCAYGFIDGPEPPDASDGAWAVQTQRPFRASYLWAWCAPGAVLTSLCLHEREQIVLIPGLPFPLDHMERLSISPTDFSRFVLPGRGQRIIEPADRRDGGLSALMQLEGAELMPEIHVLNRIRPSLMLPSIPAGATVYLGFRGRVRGLVLVGEQIS